MSRFEQGSIQDYTAGRPTTGFDASSDSTSSNVAARDSITSTAARLELLQKLSYTLPTSDAGVFTDRSAARWDAVPAGGRWGSGENCSKKLAFTIDFAGSYPDPATHYLSFNLQTGRVPGSAPQDRNIRSKLQAYRRFNKNFAAHRNDPSVLMRLSSLSNLFERYRVSAAGGVIEDVDNVDLACQIRLRAQGSIPPPKVEWLFTPFASSYSTAPTDASGRVTNVATVNSNTSTQPVVGFCDSASGGAGSYGTTATATSVGVQLPDIDPQHKWRSGAAEYPYYYNPPSEVCNASGWCPAPQNLMVQSANFISSQATVQLNATGSYARQQLRTVTPIVGCGSVSGHFQVLDIPLRKAATTDPGNMYALNFNDSESTAVGSAKNDGLISFFSNPPPQLPGAPGPGLYAPRAANYAGLERQQRHSVGMWRPVSGMQRERGYYGVDMLDDCELMFQLCTNVQTPASGSLVSDQLGGTVGRRFKMKLPCQFLNRQPILPDLKTLTVELFLQEVNIAFQGLGSEMTYETRKVCQNEMQAGPIPMPQDWWHVISNVAFECEVVKLAPSVRDSIIKGMNEGGLPMHWTQWSAASDTIGRAERFTHTPRRNVANIVAHVAVFRSPQAYTDWRFDSYRFMNPNIASLQWRLGTSLFPPTPLVGVSDFHASLRQCFPVNGSTFGRLDRLSFEGERELTIEGVNFAVAIQAPTAICASSSSGWQHAEQSVGQYRPSLIHASNTADVSVLVGILRNGCMPRLATVAVGTWSMTSVTNDTLPYPTGAMGSSSATRVPIDSRHLQAADNSLGTGANYAADGAIAIGARRVFSEPFREYPNGVFQTMTVDPMTSGLNSIGVMGVGHLTSSGAATASYQIKHPYTLFASDAICYPSASAVDKISGTAVPEAPIYASSGCPEGVYGQSSLANTAYGYDTYMGFRGVVSCQVPSSFIAARSFQTVRGIDLTGLSTLQGQALSLAITRYSGNVNLRQIALDVDPNARKCFLTADSPGSTTAGVSSLSNLSRNLYCPFTMMWDFRCAPSATYASLNAAMTAAYPISAAGAGARNAGYLGHASVVGGAAAGTHKTLAQLVQLNQPLCPVSTVTIQQLAAARNDFSTTTAQGVIVGGIIDLQRVCGTLAGTNASGVLDIPSCIQNRTIAAHSSVGFPGVTSSGGISAVTGASDGTNPVFDNLTSPDLAITSFILHTVVVLLSSDGQVSRRE